MSKQFNSWADFRSFGIEALTGEACAYSMRLLCDLNEVGVKNVADFLGLPNAKESFMPAWNGMVNGMPSVASVMLPRSVFADLATFLGFKEGCVAVLLGGGGDLLGITQSDIEHYKTSVQRYSELWNAKEVRRNWANPECSIGGRNVHQMSGRAA